MLSEKDWLIAKQLISTADQGCELKHPGSLILLLNGLLSCRDIYAYALAQPKGSTGGANAYLQGVNAVQESHGKISIKPIHVSDQELAMQLRESGGNAFPQLIEKSKQRGSICKVRLCGDTVYAYVVIQREMRKTTHSLQLLLKFSPVSELCYQKALLLETLLPSVSARLHEYILPRQPASLLTNREHEILNMIAVGNKAYRVACDLKITERTVNFHLGRIYRKLGARNRQQAIHTALREGIIDQAVNGIRSLHAEEISDIGGGFRQRIRWTPTTTPRNPKMVIDTKIPAWMCARSQNKVGWQN